MLASVRAGVSARLSDLSSLAKLTKTIDMDLLAEQAEQLISDQVEIARQMLGSNFQSLSRFKN